MGSPWIRRELATIDGALPRRRWLGREDPPRARPPPQSQRRGLASISDPETASTSDPETASASASTASVSAFTATPLAFTATPLTILGTSTTFTPRGVCLHMHVRPDILRRRGLPIGLVRRYALRELGML